jgi:hypothetical protein
VYRRPANAASPDAERLTSGGDANNKIPTGWSRDGRFLIYTVSDPKTRSDIWVLPLSGDRTPTPFLRTPFNEDQAHVSPDGRWVAYRSDESGRNEVYVRPFSLEMSGAKTLVSRTGGQDPRWRGDGKELFYVAPDLTLHAVEVPAGAEFTPGVDRPLFQLPSGSDRFVSGTGIAWWDVNGDGSRFLVPVPLAESEAKSPLPFTVLANWQPGVTPR